MNTKVHLLLTGMLKSFVAGAAGLVISLNVVDPEHFNPATAGGLKHISLAILIAGFVSECRYLKQWAEATNPTQG